MVEDVWYEGIRLLLVEAVTECGHGSAPVQEGVFELRRCFVEGAEVADRGHAVVGGNIALPRAVVAMASGTVIEKKAVCGECGCRWVGVCVMS